jgi:hypothetical protein
LQLCRDTSRMMFHASSRFCWALVPGILYCIAKQQQMVRR